MLEPLIRPHRPEDADAVAAVHTAALLPLFPAGLPMTVVVEPSAFAESERGWALVAERGGVVVGACGLAGADVSVLVAAEHRRAGVGRALVEAALADLRAAGHERAEAWVSSDDADALAFAARVGFRPTGETRGHGSKEAPERRLEAALR